MKAKVSKTMGRPRSFDRAAALETAMKLFWRHGYDGVSYRQLLNSMGVTPPTLYAAFGDKAELYQKALDHYYETRVGSFEYLEAAASLPEAARLFLVSTARALVDPRGEVGCMINIGMLASHPDNSALTQDLAMRRARFQKRIAQAFFRWLPEPQATDLARFLNIVLQGLSVQARDGAALEDLIAAIDISIDGVRTLASP